MRVVLKISASFKKGLWIIILLLSLSSFAQNNPLFEQGKELYKAEKYQDAINSWMKIIDNKQHSASLYFNLGNAHYKLANIGPSIYYYEKALQLAPNDSDIRNNLAFAENAKVDAIEPLPKTIFYKWFHSISELFTFDGWAIITVVFAFAFVLFFILYYFAFSETKKRSFFTLSILSILFFGLAFSMAFSSYEEAISNKPAIIFSESVEVKEAPNLGSETSFNLHEGTKVQIIEKDSDWMHIQIANGKEGWIPNTDLREL